ncbi:MAG: hypothetical protein OEU92_00950 [Alphaproteobacteria bacterium]|nr:hypothetical protein [Alphaproteobacteria bacterium]
MEYLSAPKRLDGVAKLWRLMQRLVGKEFWLGLILLCIVAAVSGYQVSFSITKGFQFVPVPQELSSVSDQ